MLQYKREGRTRRFNIGRYGIVTPVQARKRALELLGELEKGIDPLAAREAAREAQEAAEAERARAEAAKREADAFTARVLVERWQTIALAENRPAYRREAPRAILYLLGDAADEPATALTVTKLQNLVDAVLEVTPTHAINSRAYGRAAWNWAMRRNLVKENPFAKVAIEKRVKARDRVLSDPEVAEVWKEAGAQAYPFGPLIRLLLLTLQRKSEVAGMKWSEISQDLTTWTIPPERAKNGKAHIVHLAEPACDILRDLAQRAEALQAEAREKGEEIEPSDYVFTTTGDGPAVNVQKGRRTLERKIAKAREKEAENARRAPELDWRLHDFRRTGVSKMAELGIAPHIADKVLNHVSGTIKGVAAVYQRFEFLPERKRALEVWAQHVLNAAEDAKHPENVFDIAKMRDRKKR